MRFTCPSCSKSYRLPPERLGPAGRAQISCPNCKAVVLVKSTGDNENLECQLLQGSTGAQPAVAGQVAGQVVGQVAGQVVGQVAGQVTASATAAPAVATQAAPAAQADAQGWFVVIDREKVGPLAVAQVAERLAAGQITAHSLAWQKGMGGWEKIEQIPALMQALGPIAAPAAAPAPARASAPQAPIRQTAPQAPQNARASAPAPAANVQGAPARPLQVVPANADLDDAGPTMEAAVIPSNLGKQAPAKPQAKAGPAAAPVKSEPAKPEPAKVGAAKKGPSAADMHGDAFFGGHDLQDINLTLPDPNKHKPTKEEYQNLLQEFSVMFRLDKRSKRQKVLIAVVLSSLLLGVIGVGVYLTMSANAKRQLIRDSKEILGVFDMGYKKAVTPSIEQEEHDPKSGGAVAANGAAVAKKPPAQVSQIADRLSNVVHKKRAPSQAKQVNNGAGVGIAKGPVDAAKEAADLEAFRKKKAQEEAARQAQENAALGLKGRTEEGVGGAGLGQVLQAKDVRKMCQERAGDLLSCGKQYGGEGGYAVKLTINTNGRLTKAVALVDGKSNSELSGCVQRKLGALRLDSPKEETTYDCKVD